MISPVHWMLSFSQLAFFTDNQDCFDGKKDQSYQTQEIVALAYTSFVLLGKLYVNRKLCFERVSNLATRLNLAARRKIRDCFDEIKIRSHLSRWNDYLEFIKSEDSSSESKKSKEKKAIKGILSLREKIMGNLEQPAALNLEEIFDQYIRKKGNIVELGCGLLNAEKKSSLSRLLPNSYHLRMQYTDTYSSENAKLAKRSYIQLRADGLDKHFKENSLNHIVALCVIDCIARKKLPVVARQIYQALKPGGRVVILSDLPFHQSPLVKKHATEDNIIIPCQLDDHTLGIKIISSNLLKERAGDFGQDFLSFIEKLIELPPKKRFNFLYSSMILDNRALVSLLENICTPDCYQFIEHTESFITDLREAFEKHTGFSILECGYRVKEICMPRLEDSSFNYLAADLRMPQVIIAKQIPLVPAHHIVLGSTFFVFAAEKENYMES